MITLIQKQRERFDKNWNECNCNKGWDYGRCDRTSSISGQNCAHDEIKSFLTTCLIEHYEEDIRELEGKRQYVKYEENEMPEEEKILFVKIFGECKTPEYMVERRTGFNSALSLAISLLQDKIKELKK